MVITTQILLTIHRKISKLKEHLNIHNVKMNVEVADAVAPNIFIFTKSGLPRPSSIEKRISQRLIPSIPLGSCGAVLA